MDKSFNGFYNMTQKLFGTDGVRGIANKFLTPELAFGLGKALSSILRKQQGEKKGRKPFVVIGRDTRLSGNMLESALIAGICSVGIDVWLPGIIPTPAIAWLTRYTKAAAGIVISASHNPSEDNGIKFFNSSGYKLSDELEEEIENLISKGLKNVYRTEGADIGQVYNKKNLVSFYKNFVKQTSNQYLKEWNLLLDTANGATYKIASQIFKSLNAKVSVINAHPDGNNINYKCGSTYPDALKKKLKKGDFDIGLAFDGDGDRLLAVTKEGEEINGDQIMYICSKYLPSLKKNHTVVATVMSNLKFEQKIKEMNKKFLRTKVGDRYVLEEMLNTGAILGGEQSGHIIFPTLSPTGDGIITAIQFLNAITLSKKPVSTLLKDIQLYPQILRNIPVFDTKGWSSNPEILNSINKAEKELGEHGRVLVRPSGTEAKLRIMLEGDNQTQISKLVDMLEHTVKNNIK